MQITLEIPEKRYAFFKALMRSLSFPKIVSVSVDTKESLISKSEFFEGLKESFEEVKLMKSGKLPKKSAKDMLEEIERELANE